MFALQDEEMCTPIEHILAAKNDFLGQLLFGGFSFFVCFVFSVIAMTLDFITPEVIEQELLPFTHSFAVSPFVSHSTNNKYLFSTFIPGHDQFSFCT